MGEPEHMRMDESVNHKSISAVAKEYWILIFSAVLFVFFTSYIVATITVRMNQPKIVTFDLKGTTDDFVQKTAMLGQKATAKDVEDMTTIFKQSMQETLDKYESKGYIIMVKPAVMSGTKDITAEVRSNIYRQMRGEQ